MLILESQKHYVYFPIIKPAILTEKEEFTML